jgi:DNA-binding transcriptional regulator YhcF (GntR family)
VSGERPVASDPDRGTVGDRPAEGWRRPPSTSAIGFEIDHEGQLPPFEQLKAQVIAGVAHGTLIAGTKLPAVRTLATELGIAPNTVARAYRELEADGMLETRGRNGTVVKAKADDVAALAQLAAQDYAARVGELGIDLGTAIEYVRVALRQR